MSDTLNFSVNKTYDCDVLVGPFMSSFDPEGKEQVLKGFMDEFIGHMVEKGGAIHPTDCPGGNSYSAYRIRGHIGVTPCFAMGQAAGTAAAIAAETKQSVRDVSISELQKRLKAGGVVL